MDSRISLINRLKLKLQGRIYLGEKRKPEWTSSLPYYIFICPIHGLVEDYPHGHEKTLQCPICLKEQIEASDQLHSHDQVLAIKTVNVNKDD